MTFSKGLLIYVMLWVVTLFMVLPWGVRAGGDPTGAPAKAYVGIKLFLTCLIAGVAWEAINFWAF